jgi:hypothetical protein
MSQQPTIQSVATPERNPRPSGEIHRIDRITGTNLDPEVQKSGTREFVRTHKRLHGEGAKVSGEYVFGKGPEMNAMDTRPKAATWGQDIQLSPREQGLVMRRMFMRKEPIHTEGAQQKTLPMQRQYKKPLPQPGEVMPIKKQSKTDKEPASVTVAKFQIK